MRYGEGLDIARSSNTAFGRNRTVSRNIERPIRGLLLLSLSDITLLQQEQMSLTEFIEKGGQAIVSEPAFDFGMHLKVSDIVFALSRIVDAHPEVNH